MDANQLREHVVSPVLEALGMHSQAAEKLVLGTAAVESDLRYIRQFAHGPARGLWQMEPTTHNDIVDNWPSFKKYRDIVMLVSGVSEINARHLEYNLRYAAAFARLHYWRKPGALPPPDDIENLAGYWKRHYNTHLGAGEPGHFIEAYEHHLKPIYGG